MLWAHRHKATNLEALDRTREALAAYDELLARLGDSSTPELRDRVSGALVGKASLLLRDGQTEQAVILYDAAIARLDGSDDPRGAAPWADALLGRGKALFSQERFESAIETFDRLIDRARQASDARLREAAVIALNNKTAALNHLGQITEAIATQSLLVEEFGDEALSAFDTAIRRCAGSQEPLARESLAGALAAKAGLLAELGRHDEALSTFADLIARFESDDDIATIAHVVAMAREARDQLLADQPEDD